MKVKELIAILQELELPNSIVLIEHKECNWLSAITEIKPNASEYRVVLCGDMEVK
jgi:hypothetical protein